ncbi:hypothetical protein [Mycoplasma seminis]|uniref:Major capsid protein n=1 Tax=Mycoplasma seminis TaxID=512749 RepID=A0ABY9H9N9_9MOLU|nr:hypothetical protein [Mycoplasma seminis]WLP85242.1 hypothetical protein Q8852_02880 [Mycoplasma seminis]
MANLNAVNILKQQLNLVEAKSTGDTPITLEKVTAQNLLQHFFEKSLFSNICKNNLIVSINSQKVSVMLNPTTVFHNRGESLGSETPDKLRLGKQVDIPWNQSFYASEGITEQERQLLPIDVLASKLSRYYNDFILDHEMSAFKALENKIVKDKKVTVLNYTEKEPLEFKKELTKLATQLTQTIDKEQGIKFINREKIVIFVHPLAFDHLADAGLVGNRAAQTIEGGQYSYGELGGYKVYSNPYLQDFDAIVTTDFVAVQAVNAIKTYMGPIDFASADKVVRAEFADLYGVLYDGLALGISKTAQATTKEEDKFITDPTARTE